MTGNQGIGYTLTLKMTPCMRPYHGEGGCRTDLTAQNYVFSTGFHTKNGGQVIIKVILYSYLILKKMNERITDS